ncbi:hypothetical protein Ciccas_004067 [Cichlidogyrus casuarinus]|uniref:Uncharacterized protein n=1 Tax=Cichlidogyrus casuarinus TaxID=1844966 RepID=A0ABD2QCP4_9PLAT
MTCKIRCDELCYFRRIQRRLPVMRTNLANPHTQPIRALQVGGSANAPTLLSLSSDGIMAKWSLDMLSQPIESADLNLNAVRTTTPICMSPVMDGPMQENAMPKYLVGVESGDVVLVKPSLQSANGTGPMTEVLTSQFNHSGPIYSIQAHPYMKPPIGHKDCDFSHLFLTTSEDFTVQLRTLNSPPQTNLLHTFSESFKPVRHCCWSPVHPGMFASVDISSELFLWNINLDSEVPISKARCDRRGAFFSQCSFNPNGLSIACGDSLGHLQLFTLNEVSAPVHILKLSYFAYYKQQHQSLDTC